MFQHEYIFILSNFYLNVFSSFLNIEFAILAQLHLFHERGKAA